MHENPEINRSYLELARHYDTVVLPTRVARPRNEAAVDAGVLSVQRWVLAHCPTAGSSPWPN